MLKRITALGCKITVFFSIIFLFSSLAQGQTLFSAVQHAVHYNPDVQFQLSRRLADDQGVRQAEAGWYPSIDVNAGVGTENSHNPNPGTYFNRRKTTLKRTEAGVTATQNLFAGMATVNEIERMKAKVSASAYLLTGTAEDVGLDVVQSYLDILRLQRIVRLARINVEAHVATLGMIRERSKAGLGRKVETIQAEGRLAQARSSLVAEQGNLKDAKIAFTRVVGEWPRNLAFPAVPRDNELPRNEKAALTMALANHPTLKSALADVEEAKAQHRTSKSTNMPRVDFVLSSVRNHNVDGTVGVNHEDLAMVRMTYNLFNGGADFARQKETAYQVQEAAEVKNRTILQVEETMRLSWNAYMTARRRLPYLRVHRNSVRKTLEAYRVQFKVGKRTLLDLLDTENEQFQASISYETGRFDLLFARYRILNSMGRLLGFVGVHPLAETAVVHHFY